MKESVVVKSGKERSIRQRHPWIFSGTLLPIREPIQPGSVVEIISENGEWLARGCYNHNSQIAVRIWTWSQKEEVDFTFFAKKIQKAWQRRESLIRYTNAYRLINAENDGMPGVILDVYADHAVLQLLTAGAELQKENILSALKDGFSWEGIYERSDVDVRTKEGLPPSEGILYGTIPNGMIEIHEGEWKYFVNIREGHKTGFYLDQRDNRKLIADYFSQNYSPGIALNVFSYTGGFTIPLLSAGATSVVNVDSSAPSMAILDENVRLNYGMEKRTVNIVGDAFVEMRKLREENSPFQCIILDPPKFIFSKKDIEKGARAYKDINWLALKMLQPNGLLCTFSCSGLMTEDLFQKIIFSAALDSGRDLQIIRRVGQATDHPTRVTFPEGQYLKGFICRVE